MASEKHRTLMRNLANALFAIEVLPHEEQTVVYTEFVLASNRMSEPCPVHVAVGVAAITEVFFLNFYGNSPERGPSEARADAEEATAELLKKFAA